MTSESITIYKLIVLYMLDKVDVPLTNQIISDYILEKGYTNYFNIQKAFSELAEEDMIALDTTYKTSYYTLTSVGQETLTLFQNQLSPAIRDEIVVYLEEHRFSILEEVTTITDYKRLETGEYLATCSLNENGVPLFEVSLNTTSEDAAAKVCNNFLDKKQEIYDYLTKTLF